MARDALDGSRALWEKKVCVSQPPRGGGLPASLTDEMGLVRRPEYGGVGCDARLCPGDAEGSA